MDIISLLPSATEIVYALGLEPVGVSHECDHPPAAADKPAINRSHIDADASAEEIDQQVQKAVAEDGVYELDLAALEAAAPDLIVSQGICDVCAVDDTLVRESVAELELKTDIITTHPHSLGDVLADIERIGAAAGVEERATVLVAELQARIDAIEQATSEITVRPSVAVLDWTAPPMVAGHWVPEMVELAGGRYGLADPGDRSRPREWQAIREYDPDVLIVAPCGFDLDQTMENASDLTDRPGWRELTAVREDQVYAMDGHHYMNRPGPRLVDSLEYLAGLLHPEDFEQPTEPIAAAFPSHSVPVSDR
ncbi:MAG: ABC transporter substrate-binding protein [Halobacteriales archaeon]|nr:ABC transporter substrate-binding protein [Halobacteriales archaeon]